MDTSRRHAWVRAALLVGVGYVVIGRVFAWPSEHVYAWRLAAWLVCGGAYAAHIWYEHVRLRHSPRVTAFHAAVAVAIGAFGLAVAGMIHSLSTDSGFRTVWVLALVAFPVVTAVPAFLVALVAATGLALARRD